jgi:hypothetical protein
MQQHFAHKIHKKITLLLRCFDTDTLAICRTRFKFKIPSSKFQVSSLGRCWKEQRRGHEETFHAARRARGAKSIVHAAHRPSDAAAPRASCWES